ncbi:MAG: hypothetical protein ACRC1X_08795 [Lactobacillus panisapium]
MQKDDNIYRTQIRLNPKLEKHKKVIELIKNRDDDLSVTEFIVDAVLQANTNKNNIMPGEWNESIRRILKETIHEEFKKL